MRPDDKPVPSTTSRGAIQPPSRSQAPQQAAAAEITRTQIDKIYSDQAAVDAAADTGVHGAYARSHNDQHQISPDQWQKYHSSWQDYYQQYYERYYTGALIQAHQTYRVHAESLQQQAAKQIAQSNHADEHTISQEEAINGLRSELLGKVERSAKKVRKSRHFIPLISSVIVLLIFVFLQYNSLIFAQVYAFTSPGSIDEQNIIVDPNMSLSVSQDPRLIIPKINVDIGVQYDNTIGSTAQATYDLQMKAMSNHVAYFPVPGADSKPGQKGNVAVSGHSSNDFTDTGAAKFVFARLEQMQKGDIFYLNYQGTRYTYSVTRTQIVAPNDVKALQVGSDKAMATLITCVPLGTANNRLLVFGEQVSPIQTDTKPTPTSQVSTPSPTELTGKSPTVIERIFGAN